MLRWEKQTKSSNINAISCWKKQKYSCVNAWKKGSRCCVSFLKIRFALLMWFQFSSVILWFFSLAFFPMYLNSSVAVLQMCFCYRSHAAVVPFRIFTFWDYYVLWQNFSNNTNNSECSCCRFFMTDYVFLQFDTFLSF